MLTWKSCVPQILLLSGPPGLGKTTLAQIVANQAGYEVLEINARFVLPLALLSRLSRARTAVMER